MWRLRHGRLGYWLLPLVALLLVAAAPARAADPLPRLTAKSAIVVDGDTGTVLYARNPDERLPPASTTKILTAYLALRSGRMEDTVSVSRHASSMQPSKIWLRPGWRMRVRDLVYAVLLNSANDASVVLAEGLAGSVVQFSRRMTEEAHELGATRSRFANPSGLPAKNHYSTARDLVTILRHALAIPEMRQILSTPSTVIRVRAGSARRIALRSHNRLLEDPKTPAIGKTGYTRRAKKCFVGAANDGQREILIAMLGSKNLWGDLRQLIEYGLGPDPAPAREAELPADWQQVTAPAAETAEDAEGSTERDTSYHVRLASFRRRATALNLQRKVQQEGYPAVVERLLANRRPMYRVTVRGFTNHTEAKEAARKLGKTCRVRPQVVAIGA